MIRGNVTTWMGRSEAPVLAHLHLPPHARVSDEGVQVAGAVVLCPPLGREQVASYRTMRQLGDALAGKGLLAVRLAWSGQGDSAPVDDELTVLQNWAADLAAVVAQLRAVGVEQVHLVGLRLGALVAARQAVGLGASSVLLWDPVASGKNFLRHEQIMYTAEGLAPGDGFTALGYSLPDADAEELRALKLTSLVSDLEGSDVVLGRLERGEQDTQPDEQLRWTTSEMAAMLETSSMTARVANHAISSIVTWALDRSGSHRTWVRIEPQRRASVVHRGPHGPVELRETIVDVAGLPGILTQPADGTGDVGVLYIAASSEPMDGPSGLWTLSAREVAAEGAAALRMDKFGTGELGGPLPTDPLPYMPGFVGDVAAGADHLAELTGRKPVGVGLCSGAYFEMVGDNAARFERVVAINLLGFDRDPADIPDEVAMATDPEHVMVKAGDEQDGQQLPLKQRVRREVKTRMPQTAWRWLGRVGLAHAPDDFLRDAAAATDLVLAFSPDDFEAFRGQRGEAALAWARRHGGPVRMSVDPLLDHGLFGAMGRRRALQLVRDEVRRVRRARSVHAA